MPKKKQGVTVLEPVEPLLREVRGERVILDTDLARLYGVPTFRFNEAVKRNLDRFPGDFRFRLTAEETAALTSQTAMSKPGRGGRRTLPYAYRSVRSERQRHCGRRSSRGDRSDCMVPAK